MQKLSSHIIYLLFVMSFNFMVGQSTEFQISDVQLKINGQLFPISQITNSDITEGDEVYIEYSVFNFTEVPGNNTPVGNYRIYEDEALGIFANSGTLNTANLIANLPEIQGSYPTFDFPASTNLGQPNENIRGFRFTDGPFDTSLSGNHTFFIAVNTAIRFNSHDLNITIRPPTIPELAPDFGNLIQFSVFINPCLSYNVNVTGNAIDSGQTVNIDAQSINKVTRNVLSGGTLIVKAREGKITMKPGYKAREGCTFKAIIDPNTSCPPNRANTIPNEISGTIKALSGSRTDLGLVGDLNLRKDDQILIFPNPVSDQFVITSSDKIQKVQIYNALGKLVATENLNNKTNPSKHINVSFLTKGIYIVKVFTEYGTYSQKLIKN
ncbi:T9SS type A sorting domain-containing protein [uncultured Aquimarina sp.]|uniref:T9SS type A sorting domain-containing protein n=1 Tax=uncultured Aquimarina sp. TaxID=575652 RepID=UPI0026307A5B|nr:T9SS type A sorting domain-containing protein [uncultured Aquimarina sp.]